MTNINEPGWLAKELEDARRHREHERLAARIPFLGAS